MYVCFDFSLCFQFLSFDPSQLFNLKIRFRVFIRKALAVQHPTLKAFQTGEKLVGPEKLQKGEIKKKESKRKTLLK